MRRISLFHKVCITWYAQYKADWVRLGRAGWNTLGGTKDLLRIAWNGPDSITGSQRIAQDREMLLEEKEHDSVEQVFANMTGGGPFPSTSRTEGLPGSALYRSRNRISEALGDSGGRTKIRAAQSIPAFSPPCTEKRTGFIPKTASSTP